MKCVFISCFDNYNIRIKPVEEFLISKGYTCEYITSNFDHIKKCEYISTRDNAIQIKVLPYYKNLSIRRLLSHFYFSKQALKKLQCIKPDLIYVMLPPNSLAKFMSRYKRKHKVKLIYDLYDLWPETFPINKYDSILNIAFKYWKKIRDNNLRYADLVITECNLYQQELIEQLKGIKKEVIYPTKQDKINFDEEKINVDRVEVCYLGSINNIIDIPLIVNLLDSINKIKKVKLHIIGDGEKRETLISHILEKNIEVEFHGKIYEDKEKKKVFDKCMFGINIMKNTVCVGLTMKSIDYFQMGLPILNNIKADTQELVDENRIGFNITNENIEEIAENVASMSREDIIQMKKATQKIFELYFFRENIVQKIENIIKE